MKKVILILFYLIATVSLNAQKRVWHVYSLDSTLVAKHYWDNDYEALDSVVIKYKKKEFQLPVKKNVTSHCIDTYKEDSLSVPFDFKRVNIHKIWHIDKNNIAILAKNKGVYFETINYMHLIFINKTSLKINLWLTAINSRGYVDINFFIDTKKKKIWLPKQQNYIHDDKLFLLNMKKETFEVVSLKKDKIKSINTTLEQLGIIESGIFEVRY